MPGNYRSGRRAKQTDDREALDPDDRPQRPKGLGPDAARLWRSMIEPAQHLRRADTELAVICCRLYQVLCDAVASAESRPGDPQLLRSLSVSWGDWSRSLGQLSIDPIGRVRAGKQTRRKEVNDIAPEIRFFGDGTA